MALGSLVIILWKLSQLNCLGKRFDCLGELLPIGIGDSNKVVDVRLDLLTWRELKRLH